MVNQRNYINVTHEKSKVCFISLLNKQLTMVVAWMAAWDVEAWKVVVVA